MKSMSGRFTDSSSPRALAERDSRYWREPSACRVSKASDDLPDPLTPVITVNLCRGMTSSTFLRLWVRAPLMWMGELKVLFNYLFREKPQISQNVFNDFGWSLITFI